MFKVSIFRLDIHPRRRVCRWSSSQWRYVKRHLTR